MLQVARVGAPTTSFVAVVKTGAGRGEAVSSFGATGTSHVWYEVNEKKVGLQIMNCESNVNVVASGVKKV